MRAVTIFPRCDFPYLQIFSIQNSQEVREKLLEEYYVLSENTSLSLTEIRHMPIPVRRWYLDRLVSDLRKKNEIYSNTKNKKKNNKSKSVSDININKVNKFFKKFEDL